LSQRWFITSDPHLDHAGILRHCAFTRPFPNVDEMNDFIVTNWNHDVGKKDNVIIVGDVCFNHHDKWLSMLNGNKWLVNGNHDKMSLEIKKKHFKRVCDVMYRKINGRRFFFCHYACISWPKKFSDCIMIHGHSHGRIPEDGHTLRCDVSMDVWGMRVVPVEVIIAKMEAKDPYPEYGPDDYAEMHARIVKLAQENMKFMGRFVRRFK